MPSRRRSPVPSWSVTDKKGQKLLIRPLTTSDQAGLTTFFESLSARSRATFQPHPFTSAFARTMTQDSRSEFHLRLVATTVPAKKMVGYVFVTRPPFFLNYGYFGIGVSDRYQGRGISSLLIDAISEYARQKGVKKIYLNVYAHNTTAIASYQKRGFLSTAAPGLLSKIFTLYELWYNGQLRELLPGSPSPSSPHNGTPVWMVKTMV